MALVMFWVLVDIVDVIAGSLCFLSWGVKQDAITYCGANFTYLCSC